MPTSSFYRGNVAGGSVALRLTGLPTQAAQALRESLACAAWVELSEAGGAGGAGAPGATGAIGAPDRAGASGATGGAESPADLQVEIELLPREAPPPLPPDRADLEQLSRRLTPELHLELRWHERQAHFRLTPATSAASATSATSATSAASAAAEVPISGADSLPLAAATLVRVQSELLHLFGLFTPALALHASSVLVSGEPSAPRRAWVFCGPSGAGKTTIATVLLKDHPLIDEEIALVDPGESPPDLLNSVPPAADPRPAGVVGLFQLRQAPGCWLEPLAPGQFIAGNMTRPFDLAPPALLRDRLDKLARLTAHIDPRALHFNLDAAALCRLLPDG
ncbi:MAG: hypothetical protein ACREJ2_11885 [Planctomycetota bacterium]